MAASDPTYPLYPAACFLAAAMLLAVLFSSFIRQNWNFAVTLLCSSLMLESLISGVDAILWADNADIKFLVYCDIVTRVLIISPVIRSMSTLIITRRLYLITKLQVIETPNASRRRRDLAIEWILGVLIPTLVAGPLYLIVQQVRFLVVEGFGCGGAPDSSVLAIILIWSWNVVLPLLSISIYYPSVMRMIYLHNRDVNHVLRGNSSTLHTNYMRILVLSSIDVTLTLPVGIVTLALVLKDMLSLTSIHWDSGWSHMHAHWEPVNATYAEFKAFGTFTVAEVYFVHWAPIILSFAIFGLFGISAEARTSYRRGICALVARLGWDLMPATGSVHPALGAMVFREQMQDMSVDVEDSGLRSSSHDAIPHVSKQREETREEERRGISCRSIAGSR